MRLGVLRGLPKTVLYQAELHPDSLIRSDLSLGRDRPAGCVTLAEAAASVEPQAIEMLNSGRNSRPDPAVNYCSIKLAQAGFLLPRTNGKAADQHYLKGFGNAHDC